MCSQSVTEAEAETETETYIYISFFNMIFFFSFSVFLYFCSILPFSLLRACLVASWVLNITELFIFLLFLMQYFFLFLY